MTPEEFLRVCDQEGMEHFTEIPIAPGHYVSNLGRVLRETKDGLKEVPQHLSRTGYPRVGLKTVERWKTIEVHQLLLLGFDGPRPADKPVSRHLDSTPTNNKLSNVVYGTQTENMQDRLKAGRNPQSNKTHCPQGHPYDEANTYWAPPNAHQQVNRLCRSCQRDKGRRYRNAKQQKKEQQS